MRKQHKIIVETNMRCPKESCGSNIAKKIEVTFTTNQRGDVIESRAKIL